MSESLEQRALRIAHQMVRETAISDEWFVEFARRLMAEQGEPVGFGCANEAAGAKAPCSSWCGRDECPTNSPIKAAMQEAWSGYARAYCVTNGDHRAQEGPFKSGFMRGWEKKPTYAAPPSDALDAKRYRWHRKDTADWSGKSEAEIDAAIDRAMEDCHES